MAKKLQIEILPEQLDSLVHIVRGQRVMLDSDLAQLYGATAAALNQAVRRNADRFPNDFAYQLTQQEVTALISQIVISKPGRAGHRKLPSFQADISTTRPGGKA